MAQSETVDRRGGIAVMQNTSESLFRELGQLEAIFSTVSENLAKAAERFRTSRIAPPPELVADLANYERRLGDLAHRIREHAKSLSLSPGQLSNLSSASLDDVKRSLQVIAEVEEKNAKMAIKVKAVAALDRALCLVRRDRAASPPIAKFQLTAQAIRESIVNSSALELPPGVRDLAEGKHVISRLLDLIERQENLTDDECLKLHETVAESLGKELAVAALRGRLEVPSPEGFGAEKVHSKPAVDPAPQKRSAPAEVKPRRGSPAPVESASVSPQPVAQADLDLAVGELLDNRLQEAARRTEPVRTAPGKPRVDGTESREARTLSQAVAGTKRGADTVEAEPPAEEASAPQAAIDVGNAVMEAIRVEEVADRCLAEGKLAEAESNYQRLLALQNKLFDAKDPKVVRTTQNLATVERLQRRRRAEADKSKEEPLSATSYQGPVILASIQPAAEDGTTRRIGIAATVILAVVMMVFAVMRYWPAAVHAVSPPAANSPAAGGPAANPALAEPSLTPEDSNPSEVPAQAPAPGAKPEARLPIQDSSQPMIQPGGLSQRDLIVNSSARRTLTSAGSATNGVISPDATMPVSPVPPERVRVGAFVGAPKLISKINPVYPAAAKNSRIQGTVHLEALIGKDGFIANLTVISGPALLIKPAMDAVKVWRYEPTMLDGKIVEVETPVDVNFALNP